MWMTAMHALKHYSSHLLTTPASSAPDAGTIGESRTNWAGYNANSASNGGDAFTAAETQFTVPAVQANSKYPSYEYGDPMDTFWAALGGGYTGNGDGTTYINQAGVETVSQNTPSYYFTTELAGSSGPVREGPVIGAYDTAYAEVWYTDASGGNAYVNFYLENDSSGSAQHFILSSMRPPIVLSVQLSGHTFRSIRLIFRTSKTSRSTTVLRGLVPATYITGSALSITIKMAIGAFRAAHRKSAFSIRRRRTMAPGRSTGRIPVPLVSSVPTRGSSLARRCRGVVMS